MNEKLTTQQRVWLGHLRACGNGRQTLAAYAAQQGLNVRALYDARKRLKRRGVLPEAVGEGRFVRVTPAEPLPLPAGCRVLLRNGVVVEWLGGGAELERILQAAARLP